MGGKWQIVKGYIAVIRAQEKKKDKMLSQMYGHEQKASTSSFQHLCYHMLITEYKKSLFAKYYFQPLANDFTRKTYH